MRYGQHPNESWGGNWQQLHAALVRDAVAGVLKVCPYCNHPIKIKETVNDRIQSKQNQPTA